MLTVSALAERDGVSKPAVSRKVKQLVEAHGLQVTRDEQGRVSGVNVAQYDELRHRFDDPSKAQAAGPAAATTQANQDKPGESYDEALRQKTWIEAERARIRLAQEKGELVEAAAVAAALGECGGEIARTVDRLLGYSDELAAAFARDGLHGLRVVLKRVQFELKAAIATSLEGVAARNDEADDETSAQPEEAAAA